MADGFLNRWSQRKRDVLAGKPLAEPVNAPVSVPVNVPVIAPSNAPLIAPLEIPPADSTAESAEAAKPAAPGLPTLADVQQLTPASDFKPFMVRGVAADVKNAAMKKLFADPHFNVMDRLDTYIDDYSIADPIPEAMLRKMVSAKFLNLFDEEEHAEADEHNDNDKDKDKAKSPSSDAVSQPVKRDVPDTAAPEIVAQCPLPIQAPTLNDDDTDLRLQPDHALERQGLGRGAG